MGSNVMSLVKASNKKRLNPFDLSYKHAYTSKLGQILPFHIQPIFPGDRLKFHVEDFTRTLPADSSAYARIRKNVEFYFVPFHALWRYWDSFISDVELRHSADSINDVGTGKVNNFPVTTLYEVLKVLQRMGGKNGSADPSYRPLISGVGLGRMESSAYLLQLLRYGDIPSVVEQYRSSTANQWVFNFESDTTFVNLAKSTVFNPSSLLAYQKIFNDHFRFDQWLLSNPSCFNLDYIVPDQANNNFISLSPLYSGTMPSYTMFDMHYAFYRKDLFKGILPSAQYGDESILKMGLDNASSSINFSNFYFKVGNSATASAYDDGSVRAEQASTGSSNMYIAAKDPTDPDGGSLRLHTGSLDGLDLKNLSTSLGILALRKATALQRRKEISISNRYTYKDQVRAHWGSTPSSDTGHCSSYLGGFSFDISFDEVVNTNLVNEQSPEIKGKGIGSSSSSFKCSFDDYGILIGVQYKEPLLDYANEGRSMLSDFRSSDDFPIPEFDAIGMETLPLSRQLAFAPRTLDVNSRIYPVDNSVRLGYVPRYAEFKTSIDLVSGAFNTIYPNWVIRDSYRDFIAHNSPLYSVTYSSFLIKPSLLDNIFGVAADSSNDSDQFLDNTFVGIKSLRNFDRNGLPY